MEELQQICPSIAEVLNFCELAKDVTNVSAGLSFHMDQVVDSVQSSQKHFKSAAMPHVMFHLSQIETSVKEIIETRKQGAFGDGTLVTKIFHEMQKQRE